MTQAPGRASRCPQLAALVTAATVSMQTLGLDVLEPLDALAVATTAIVGISMGGVVAMEMLAARPSRFWAVGLIATTAEVVTDVERGRAGRWTEDPWSGAAVTEEIVEHLTQPDILPLDGVGHLPNLEAEQRFNDALGGFLHAHAPAG